GILQICRAFCLAVCCVALLSSPAVAQDNYEVQVYPYETVAPRATMVELHSNFTASGLKEIENGVRPTNHAVHETSRSRTAGMTGSKLASTSLLRRVAVKVGSGWGITFVLACACRRNGSGRLV